MTKSGGMQTSTIIVSAIFAVWIAVVVAGFVWCSTELNGMRLPQSLSVFLNHSLLHSWFELSVRSILFGWLFSVLIIRSYIAHSYPLPDFHYLPRGILPFLGIVSSSLFHTVPLHGMWLWIFPFLFIPDTLRTFQNRHGKALEEASKAATSLGGNPNDALRVALWPILWRSRDLFNFDVLIPALLYCLIQNNTSPFVILQSRNTGFVFWFLLFVSLGLTILMRRGTVPNPVSIQRKPAGKNRLPYSIYVSVIGLLLVSWAIIVTIDHIFRLPSAILLILIATLVIYPWAPVGIILSKSPRWLQGLLLRLNGFPAFTLAIVGVPMFPKYLMVIPIAFPLVLISICWAIEESAGIDPRVITSAISLGASESRLNKDVIWPGICQRFTYRFNQIMAVMIGLSGFTVFGTHEAVSRDYFFIAWSVLITAYLLFIAHWRLHHE
jgi:hypothetical protein